MPNLQPLISGCNFCQSRSQKFLVTTLPTRPESCFPVFGYNLLYKLQPWISGCNFVKSGSHEFRRKLGVGDHAERVKIRGHHFSKSCSRDFLAATLVQRWMPLRPPRRSLQQYLLNRSAAVFLTVAAAGAAAGGGGGASPSGPGNGGASMIGAHVAAAVASQANDIMTPLSKSAPELQPKSLP